MKFLGLVISLNAICFAARPVHGCTMSGSAIDRFDRASYVFLGRVTGYTEAVMSIQGKEVKVFGLEVSSVERVFVPKESNNYTVFPLRIMADCNERGLLENEIKAKYQIGTTVRVVAQESQFVRRAKSRNIVLEAGFHDHTSISPNISDDQRLISSIDSVSDYSTVASISNNYSFLVFEIQKDLFRLENAKSNSEVETIVKRLEQVPSFIRIVTSEIRREYIMRIRN